MSQMIKKTSVRAQRILEIFEFSSRYQISDIASLPEAEGISLATLKRDLSSLAEAGYIKKTGTTSNLVYSLTDFGLLHRKYDIAEYARKSENERRVLKNYNFSILDILSQEAIFTEKEMQMLHSATNVFRERGNDKSNTIQTKELERFIIELSWKSSKIEGNTYTLLDTEKLIKEGVEAIGHNKNEAVMILNHKKAFSYILECKKVGKSIVSFLELQNIHRLLVEELGVTHGLRKSAVGITGTSYLPLSNSAQIEEETRKLIQVLAKKEEPFSASLLSILGISYLQPFEDGNKRTARLFSNGILITSNLAPLSYRSVDEREYREAILMFYEQNSLEAFKKIFIDQYTFSSENYNVS